MSLFSPSVTTTPFTSWTAKPKQPAPHASAVAAVPAQDQREAPVSDTAWVAAVRSALVNHERDATTASIPPASAPVSLAPPPHTLGELPAPQALPSAPLAAPALPPPAEVAIVAPPQADPDHPVPPGAIPEAPVQDPAKKPSRIG